MKSHATFKRNLVMACTAMALASIAQSALAEDAPETEYTLLDSIKQGKPLTNFRLRYESVDQDLFQPAPNATKKLDTANAFTLRSLIGWQTAPFHNFSFAAQITDVHEFNDDFNDKRGNVNEPGKTKYPAIVDPGYTDINQLYVDWTGIKNTKLRLGRQQVNLDNVRFIGDIGFRQNMQVFDGVSVLNKSIPDTEIFAAHFDKVRQINTELRSGNIDIVNAKYRISPSESLVGYGYFVDVANLSQNNGSTAAASTAAQGGNGLGPNQDLPASKSATTDASSKTFGARLDGVRKIDDNWKVLYTAEYAKQDNYQGGSSFIDAHYFKLGGGAMYDVWSLRVDQEVLSSNHGKYGFQTPLGTNHLFQGWADQFLVTPRQGIKDTFVTFAGSIEKAKLLAEYHVFKSDEKFATLNGQLGDKYGTEFDASVAYPFTANVMGKLEYAKFMEDDVYGTTTASTNTARKGDKEIIWATAMYTF
ncbi:MAG: alginate export family protein [Pseudomonadota bacterium]